MAANFYQDGDVLDYTNTTGVLLLPALRLPSATSSALRWWISLSARSDRSQSKACGRSPRPPAMLGYRAPGDLGCQLPNSTTAAHPATGDISNCVAAAYAAAASGDTVGYVKLNVGMGTVT